MWNLREQVTCMEEVRSFVNEAIILMRVSKTARDKTFFLDAYNSTIYNQKQNSGKPLACAS